MKTKLICVLTALSAGMAGSALAGNIVQNGDFETADFTGWNNTGPTDNFVTSSVGGVTPSIGGGSFFADFGAVGAADGINQSLATTAGTKYDISFTIYNAYFSTPNSALVTFGSTTLFSRNDAAGFGWTTYSYVATASSSTTILDFEFRQVPGFYALDNVQVTPVSAPDAGSTLGIFGAALGALLAARRKFVN